MTNKNYDFGLTDKNGKPLRIGQTVEIELGETKIEVKLEFEKGVFGFHDNRDDGLLIPIAWHKTKHIKIISQ